jgi:uncharacterized membrane protein
MAYWARGKSRTPIVPICFSEAELADAAHVCDLEVSGMVELERDSMTGDRRIVLRPNASLTPRQARLLLGAVGLVMAGIAAGFASLGLWLVLPFSGAEWLLLVYCFKLGFRACSACEVITITEALVLLEKGQGKPEQKYRFQRAWVSLDWAKPPIMGHPSRLSFRLHGQYIEIGRFLAESEREALARELQQILLKSH